MNEPARHTDTLLASAELTHYDTSDGFTTLTLCGISLFPKPGEIGSLLTVDPALVTCPGCLARL